ncbi:MAG: GntR family transcriptional regulator [Clostridia bacterium]|nr:GntR family transcriptional regulator [Clostridia bacterium]
MINLDYRSRVPIYDQIVNGIIKLRTLGVLKADDKLPSVRQLASELRVNPNTVQKAYAILEGEKIIYSISGKGSFISGDADAENSILNAAKEEFKKAVLSAAERGISRDELVKILEESLK